MFGWSFQFVRPIHCSWMGKYWYSNSGQYHPHRWWFKIKKNSTEAHSAWSFIPLSATAGWKTYIRSRCEARRISEASTAVNMTYTRFFPKASPMLGFSFSCWNRVGAIRKRRICGRYCYVTMLYMCGAVGAQLRRGGRLRRECVDAAVTVVCGAVGVWLLFSCYLQLLGVDVAETKLRTMLLPCYLQLLGV